MEISGFLLRNRRINMALQKFLVMLHNKSYFYLGILAAIYNDNLHPKHRLIVYHRFFIDNIRKGSAVLDIGCGNGALTYDLAKKARKIVGIDLSRNNIRIARNRYSRHNIEYLHGDATNYNFKEKFDFVILSNTLEHLNERVKFLRKVSGLAAVILIRVPMIDRDWITLYKKEIGCEYRLDKSHRTEYSLKSFQGELGKAGLSSQKYSIQFGEIWAVVKNENCSSNFRQYTK